MHTCRTCIAGDGVGDNDYEGKEIAFTPFLWMMVTIIPSKPQKVTICNLQIIADHLTIWDFEFLNCKDRVYLVALLGFLRSQLKFKRR